MKPTSVFFTACTLACALALGAGAPAAVADGERPAREEYAEALDTAYRGNLMDMGAEDSDIDAFGECIVEATYEKMSPKAVTAIATDDFDYQLEDADATLFLEATESCLASTGLADLEMPEEGSDDTQDDAATGEAGTGSSAASDEQAEATTGANSQATAGSQAESAAAAGGETQETSGLDSSASWRLPLAMGLFVLGILGASGYLVLSNRSRARNAKEALENADEAKVSDILS